MDFTDLFAGVRVRDIADARAWYERLLGSEPAFFPNDVEAVWAVGEHRWFYLLEDASKAGSALVTIMVADLDATAEAIGGRGIEPTELEDYGEARKYVFHDPTATRSGSARFRPPGSLISARKCRPPSAPRPAGATTRGPDRRRGNHLNIPSDSLLHRPQGRDAVPVSGK